MTTKLILTTLLAGFLAAPAALACDTCKKHNKKKEKEDETVLVEKAASDDCKHSCKCAEKCESGTEPALADKCKKCDGDKKDEPALA